MTTLHCLAQESNVEGSEYEELGLESSEMGNEAEPQYLEPQSTDSESSSASAPSMMSGDNGEDKEYATGELRHKMFSLWFGQSSTSDNLFLQERHIGWTNRRKDFSYAYTSEQENFFNWGFLVDQFNGHSGGTPFRGNNIALNFGYKWGNQLSTDYAIGSATVVNENAEVKKSLMTQKLNVASFLLNETIFAVYNFEKAFIYPELGLPAGIEQYTWFNKNELEIKWQPVSDWRSHVKYTIKDFSDNNSRKNTEVKSLYGISPGWPWIWVGVHYSYLTNSKNIAGYWTPSEFVNRGIRLESAYPIFGSLSAVTEIHLNSIKEEDNEEGNGYVYYVGLQHGDRNQLNFKLTYMKLESSQLGTQWNQETVMFYLLY